MTPAQLQTLSEMGYKSRFLKPLPERIAIILIAREEKKEIKIYPCLWQPAPNPEKRSILGTATVESGKFAGIRFHTWKNISSEFVYYKIIKQ